MPRDGIKVTRQIKPHAQQEHREYRHENQVYWLARFASLPGTKTSAEGNRGRKGGLEALLRMIFSTVVSMYRPNVTSYWYRRRENVFSFGVGVSMIWGQLKRNLGKFWTSGGPGATQNGLSVGFSRDHAWSLRILAILLLNP